MTKLKVTLLIFLVSALTACSKKNSQPNVELIQDMMDSPAVKAQDYDPRGPGGLANRLPPEGTVPQGYKPYEYHGNLDGALKGLSNPIRGDVESLKIGHKKFEIYCGVCHGLHGNGDGTVAEKFGVPVPSLNSDKVKAMPDQHIFHIITDGQGVMSSYASQIKEPMDRWAIVNYIRTLQKQ